MIQLPPPDVYEQEMQYMPWGAVIDDVVREVSRNGLYKGTLLDAMCGPGHLLNKLRTLRPDLNLEGFDIDERYIEHARANAHSTEHESNHPGRHYAPLSLEVTDAITWSPQKQYDIVLCTGGVHHLPYERQGKFISRLAEAVKPSGFAIIADPCIAPYKGEDERVLRAAELGLAYARETVVHGAPRNIVLAALDVMENDITGSEFKTSANVLERMCSPFSHIMKRKIWPDSREGYGDYMFVLRHAQY